MYMYNVCVHVYTIVLSDMYGVYQCYMYYFCVQGMGATELTLEGVSGVGSEMERIHIAEKNKAMAAKLKVMHMYTLVLNAPRPKTQRITGL